MKITIAIAISLSLFTTSVAVFGTSSAEDVHAISSKQKNIFIFKADKSWQGALVEVLDANGECVTREKLWRRKMIINFKNLNAGTYKIIVTKNGNQEEFQYTKK